MAEGDCPGASSAGAAVVRITRLQGYFLIPGIVQRLLYVLGPM